MGPGATVHPAATVIVLRDSLRGPEVFMVRRDRAVAFMGGAHVFPGGRVDSDDRSADETWCDGVLEAGRRIPGMPAADALAFHVAAARELFEEAGVLIARKAAGEYVSLTRAEDRDRFKDHRAELNAGRRTLRTIAESEGLKLALDALVLYAHWVTPPHDVRRFDTRFFATRVPAHQTPAHDDHEASDSMWITPSGAIEAVRRNEIVLPPPTWATLRELDMFTSVDTALSWAHTRPIHRREPRVILEDGEPRRLILPGDPLMPEPDPVAFETRFVRADGHWRPERVA